MLSAGIQDGYVCLAITMLQIRRLKMAEIPERWKGICALLQEKNWPVFHCLGTTCDAIQSRDGAATNSIYQIRRLKMAEIPETRLIAIRDWKEPWYSTGVHVPADEMAAVAAELLAARARIRELEQALRQIHQEPDGLNAWHIADKVLASLPGTGALPGDGSLSAQLHATDKAVKP
jgi:cobalamin biosynthesis Mg chelatase CobN